MITLKNNKLPRLHLFLNGYEIKSENEYVREYRKTIVAKDEFNYGMFYYIHVFYHKKETWSDICVSTKEYNPYAGDWMYDWYSGDYIDKSWKIIGKYDKRLLKYIESMEEI